MQRRKFFKSIVASIAGLFAVSKTAKAQEKPKGGLNLDDLRQELKNAKYINKSLFFKLFDKLEGRETPTVSAENTALRFNENRIEAWNGERWVNVFEVDVISDQFCCTSTPLNVRMAEKGLAKPVHKNSKNV
jgi:hypothetical protein